MLTSVVGTIEGWEPIWGMGDNRGWSQYGVVKKKMSINYLINIVHGVLFFEQIKVHWLWFFSTSNPPTPSLVHWLWCFSTFNPPTPSLVHWLWCFSSPHPTPLPQVLCIGCGVSSPHPTAPSPAHTQPPYPKSCALVVAFLQPAPNPPTPSLVHWLWRFSSLHPTPLPQVLCIGCGVSPAHTQPPYPKSYALVVVFLQPTPNPPTPSLVHWLWCFSSPHPTPLPQVLCIGCGVSPAHTQPPYPKSCALVVVFLQPPYPKLSLMHWLWCFSSPHPTPLPQVLCIGCGVSPAHTQPPYPRPCALVVVFLQPTPNPPNQ